jgi:hypothetical protein
MWRTGDRIGCYDPMRSRIPWEVAVNIGKERRTIIIEPVETPAQEPASPPEPPREAPPEPTPEKEPALVPNR